MSNRLASIDRDLALSEPPANWTGGWVCERLVEAYRIERRLPGEKRHTQRGLWPKSVHDFSDVVGWDDARERILENWSHAHTGVYAVEVSRMDEAHNWLRVQLAKHPVERACLASWATCVAYSHSLRAMMVRRGWSRSTFYRRVDDGSSLIARALRVEGVEVR